ncbi:hypothetical protein C8F01DRAFT_370209 [Mycena amicta]|nr:hypothetical protein C8F01DRAFT_370209 [Mycena amicta]
MINDFISLTSVSMILATSGSGGGRTSRCRRGCSPSIWAALRSVARVHLFKACTRAASIAHLVSVDFGVLDDRPALLERPTNNPPATRDIFDNSRPCVVSALYLDRYQPLPRLSTAPYRRLLSRLSAPTHRNQGPLECHVVPREDPWPSDLKDKCQSRSCTSYPSNWVCSGSPVVWRVHGPKISSGSHLLEDDKPHP